MSPCEMVKIGQGYAILCTGNPRRRRCRFCASWSTKLCDWPIRLGKTCDVPICDEHATPVGENLDYCPTHRGAAK